MHRPDPPTPFARSADRTPLRDVAAAHAQLLVAIALAGLVIATAGVSFTGVLPADRPASPTASGEIAPGADGFPILHKAGGVLVGPEAYPGQAPSFEQRYVGPGGEIPGVDREPSAWEPTLGIGPDGTAYYLAASRDVDPRTGVADYDQVQISKVRPPEVWRSTDQGLTWTDVSPDLLAPQGEFPSVAPPMVEEPPSSGDPFLHVDPTTGRIFSYQQQAYVLCDHWAISPDRGSTWDTWDTCQDEASWGDHPSITTAPPREHTTEGYPNVVHFCASSGCRASFDGGTTWTDNVQTTTDCEQQNGHLKSGPDGTLYLPRKNCGGAHLAISQDDGQTWTEVLVDDTVWQGSVEDAAVHDHEAHVAIDTDNNLHYLWIGEDHLPYLSTSTDGGTTWTDPLAVAAPGVTHALFPHIVAGGPGQVGLFYFATTVESGEREDPEAVWNGYVSFTQDALTTDPVFATTLAHEAGDPLHRGPCYLWRCYVAPGPAGAIPEELKQVPYEGYPPNGLGMEGVYDFLDMEINPATGAVWIALVDLCNGTCAEGDGEARARAAVSVQVAGTQLTG